MPILMHLLLSFMKGVRTSLSTDEKPAPSPQKAKEETNDFPMPGNLIPSDVKKDEEIASTVLDVEDSVKSLPVNPVIEQKQQEDVQEKKQIDALNALTNLPPKKKGLEPLKSPEPLSTDAEKKTLAEAD